MQGEEGFQGTCMHAKDFNSVDMATGKRVLIVGAGNTALDCVAGVSASAVATSATLLYRQVGPGLRHDGQALA